MIKQTNIWHPNIQQLTWQISDGAFGREVDIIQDTSERIIDILDAEWKENVRISQNRLDSLLLHFWDEIDIVSDSIWFNYDHRGYINKLSLDKSYVLRRLELLLNDNPKLKSLYSRILDMMKGFRSEVAINNVLYTDFLEDLAYEYVVRNGPSIFPAEGRELFDKSFDYSELALMFQNIENYIEEVKKLPVLTLEFIQLWTFPIEKLQFLFDSLWHLKYLDISWNDLNDLKENHIKPLFANLNLKFIKLIKVYYSQLSPEYIKTLFSCLQNLNAISLSQSDIWILDKEYLLCIFPYLNRVKYIDIRFTNLSWLTEDDCRIIFSNLPNVVNINLDFCHLCELSDRCLEIIFSNLKNLKVLHIDMQRYSNEQIELIMKIHPNLIIEH